MPTLFWFLIHDTNTKTCEHDCNNLRPCNCPDANAWSLVYRVCSILGERRQHRYTMFLPLVLILLLAPFFVWISLLIRLGSCCSLQWLFDVCAVGRFVDLPVMCVIMTHWVFFVLITDSTNSNHSVPPYMFNSQTLTRLSVVSQLVTCQLIVATRLLKYVQDGQTWWG